MISEVFAKNSSAIFSIVEDKLPFIKFLSYEESQKLALNSSILNLNKNAVFRCASNDKEYILLVLSGRMRIHMISESGKEITLALLDKNDVFFSSEEYFGQGKLLTVLQAEDDCDILKINMEEIISHSNKLQIKKYYISELVKSYIELSEVLMSVVSENLERRIARLMIREVKRNGTDTVYLTHNQIATYLNSTREQISRILGDLSKKGITELGYGKLIIKDFDAIERMANM